MKSESHYFNEDGHLSDLGIALWIENLTGDQSVELPETVADHGEECMDCKEIIVELCQTWSQDIYIKKQSRIQYFYSQKPLFFKIAAIALILIVTGFTLYYFISARKSSPQELFTENFNPYQDIISIKGSQEIIDDKRKLLLVGIYFYNSMKYDSSSVVFEYLNKETPSNDTIAFYLANSLLATGKNPKKVIKLLTTLSKNENIFTQHSKWYLALAYLQNNNPGSAKSCLLDIVDKSTIYKEKAQTILNELQ